MDQKKTLRKIQIYLFLFFLGILFGLQTVVFVEIETDFLARHFGQGSFIEDMLPYVSSWIEKMNHDVTQTYERYPVMAYCMDWLSYACLVFALFIIGAIKNPVKNIWIIQAYMIACILAAILPFMVGPFRGIPLFWRFIDGSFGAIGFILLIIPYHLIKQLQTDLS